MGGGISPPFLFPFLFPFLSWAFPRSYVVWDGDGDGMGEGGASDAVAIEDDVLRPDAVAIEDDVLRPDALYLFSFSLSIVAGTEKIEWTTISNILLRKKGIPS